MIYQRRIMTSTWCSCLRGLTSKRLCGHFSAAPYYSCVPENLLRTKLSVSRTIDPSRKFHPFNLTKSAKFSSSSTATLTPKPSPSFDPDIHFVPSSSSSRNNDRSDVENPSEHEEAEVPSTENLPADWQNVPIVYTTGVSYKGVDGVPVAKIGVFWGDGDVLNRFKVLGNGLSAILAEIEAVTLALKQAIYEQELQRVIIRTDSDYVCRCIAKYFNYWKQNDFYKADGVTRVKYAEELQEVDRLLTMIEAKVEHFPKNRPDVGNWVLAKLKPKKTDEQRDDIQWATSETASSSSSTPSNSNSIDPQNCMVVYTCGAYRDTDLRGESFTRAGLGVYCPENPENNISRRLSMFPVTLFRSQLQAIIVALEQAVDMKYESVIIRTDSRVFLKYIMRQWKKADGAFVKNYSQYLRIIDLASRIKVKFELAGEQNEAKEEALVLAEDGMSLPMVNEAKRLLKRGVSDPVGSTIQPWKVVVDSCDGDWTGVPRVCLLSKIDPEIKRRAVYCVYWNDEEHQHLSSTGCVDGVKRAGSLAIQKALILALEQAVESDQKRLIIRMSAVRLLKTVIEWLPQWRRNQWMNSLKKPIMNADQWKYLDELMQNVEIKWEYADPEETKVDELSTADGRAEEYLKENFIKIES